MKMASGTIRPFHRHSDPLTDAPPHLSVLPEAYSMRRTSNENPPVQLPIAQQPSLQRKSKAHTDWEDELKALGGHKVRACCSSHY